METSRIWVDSPPRHLASTPVRYPTWGLRQIREHEFPLPFSQFRYATHDPGSCRCLGTWPYTSVSSRGLLHLAQSQGSDLTRRMLYLEALSPASEGGSRGQLWRL